MLNMLAHVTIGRCTWASHVICTVAVILEAGEFWKDVEHAEPYSLGGHADA
jgi:hypothetical protein